MKHISLKFLIFVWSLPVLAQKYTVNNGDTIQVRVSSREINRILVDSGRINKVWGSSGILEIKPDKENGEIYVKPTENAEKSFSFFVKDDHGATYTLIATQSDIPSQTITIVPKIKFVRSSRSKNEPYVLKIKKLLKEMALGVVNADYRVREHDKEVKLWKDVHIRLQKSYANNNFSGEIYSLRNISNKNMRFKESEFLGFGSNVKAVSLDKHELEKDQTATLYVIRGANG